MNNKCQVFTPSDQVFELLDRVGYTANLYGKKVIENACGDGNILKAIVERYIIDSLKNSISNEDIKQGLETDIYGAEIDEVHHLKCLQNLEMTANKHKIYGVSWKVLNVDILREKLDIKFDYVIGNPPYIKYKELDNETRMFVKENYEVCVEGKFDYCYAFIEASLKCLNEGGKLAYLIPNSIFKNVFGQRLRDFMLPTLTNIYDYTTEKLFESALTSSAIIILDKGKKSQSVKYHDVVKNTSYDISKTELIGKWVFSNAIKNNNCIKNKVKFSDYFTASIVVATLLNEAFVLKSFKEYDDYIAVENFKIEKNITREAVSPRSINYNKNELIIFPYFYRENILQRYEEDEFVSVFPETAKFLKKYSEKLDKRKSDKNAKWYEYGRTQALAHLNQEKLLTSTVVTKQLKVYSLSKECIPYSGIYIVSNRKLPLSAAKKVLESESFYNYVLGIGINASGTSLRITAKDINNYEFLESDIL